ncbi:MAG: heat-inducible transcriptional repressor HrcA [Gammaproteobacteria bacterium]|nr:heat-inducible transcriptional repressor HrcA [Gammaproteobacteria bacterium]MCP5424332.1 heat-inducible transcriptional repressor HrcA [Gammaproteobacteria bacterium]MCP5459086.1 heat-inducible transcriptional repressor HrcA [Gammaproteobacteria bacterium]
MSGDQVPNTELNERSRYLLRMLVERYIRDGQPVGSRTLARDAGSDLSPATIRNVMADLEDLGYLKAPHTSAGRIPTVRGYRFFVDSLLQVKPLPNVEVEALRRHLVPHQGTGSLVQAVSDMLSGVTQLVGVVMVPRRQSSTLRHVEFLPLTESRVLAILVINEQEVQNRIIHTKRPYTPAELQQAANYLNAQFAGKDIHQVRTSLLREMSSARDAMNALMQTVIDMANQTFQTENADREDYVLAGQTNLMDVNELADIGTLRDLFEAFSRKQDILHLLDQCLHAQGVQIFIGSEAGCEVLESCSIVTAPYSVEDKLLGVLGVIGPTRMAYDRVIPVVEMTAKLLASALNSRD